MRFHAVVVAAGSGTRAGPGGAKQWRLLAGKPVLRWSVEALAAAGASQIACVVPAGDEDYALTLLSGIAGVVAVAGGANRAASVQAGLAALTPADNDAIVLVHDAARPFLETRHVSDLIAALANADGAVPALPVADTLKKATPGTDAVVTTPRDGLWRAQTPQAFRLKALLEAYAGWPAHAEPTDDAAVMEADGGRVVMTAGDPMLFKLTYPEDFAMAERLAVPPARATTTRIGMGYDAHRWGPGTSVWLCGVEIAHGQTLVGHSDADAGLHALTDALLGTVGEGDIGDHFPPTDPQWKGAPSDVFLKHAVDLVRARGGRVLNVDVTLICERPKIKPHRTAMRERLAQLLGVALDQVSVKATTTEGMGFTGREEGLAAQAVAAVELPG